MAGVVAVVALVFGHLWFWYGATLRSGLPDGAGAADLLYRQSSLPITLWVPFPHQNLGALEERVGDLEAYLGALSQLVGIPAMELPSFGPFRLPPARSLALVASEDGAQICWAAEVYPTIAWIARLAGKMAGNPWLSGGEVSNGDRTLSIEWRGTSWIAGTPGCRMERPDFLDAVDPMVPKAPAIARLRLGATGELLPAGTYVVRQTGGGVQVELTSAVSTASAVKWPSSGLPLLMISGKDASALAFPGGDTQLANWKLPAAVVLAAGAELRWRLPAHESFDLLKVEVKTGQLGAWKAEAVTQEALDAALSSKDLPRLLERAVTERLDLAVLLNVGEARGLVSQVADTLETIPLIGDKKARPWRQAEAILAPWTDISHAGLVVSMHEPRFLLWLESEPSMFKPRQ